MFTLHIFGQNWELSERHINMGSIFVILTSGMFLFFGITITTSAPIALFLTSLIFITGGRTFFILALGFLIVTAVFTALKKEVMAESAAIIVYYLLLSGTLLELIDDKLHLVYIRFYRLVKKYYKQFHA